MLDSLRVYDSSLPREPQWGEDFFGIDPFYIALGIMDISVPGRGSGVERSSHNP